MSIRIALTLLVAAAQRAPDPKQAGGWKTARPFRFEAVAIKKIADRSCVGARGGPVRYLDMNDGFRGFTPFT